MKLYLIGGLGADKRVFKYLNLNCETQVINWIEPKFKETISSYSQRLIAQINQKEKYGILGVSFGGLIAVELSKLIEPEKVILISSAETKDQLPRKYISLGKTKILNVIPNSLIKPPKPLLKFLFGAKDKKLLEQIIKDTNPAFIRWALNTIINWSNIENTLKPIRIHGTNDKLIPLKGKALKIKNAGHFMIVDNAEEISILVNEQIKYAG
ncbi:MAG: alpha/beta hydrolase [Aureispira sp.]